ncbi:MAG: hypothetical protein Q7R40_00705 [Phaeospirillum sp.]|nr:hypothetical protein [Phaeospirillum sp.]
MSAPTTTQQTGCAAKDRKCYQAATIVSDVLERLLRETSREGMVRVEDAVKIMRLVGRGTYELDVAFEHQEKKCRQDLAPARNKASSRTDPFRRMMVRPFETLLNGDQPPYPRPLLGNYFDVLEAAYADKYTEYERASKALMQALLVSHGNNLEWDAFHGEPRVSQIMVHALKRLLRFLDSPTGQRAWLTTMSRPAPNGLRPSAEQTDSIRDVLSHTVRGLEMMTPTMAQAASS